MSATLLGETEPGPSSPRTQSRSDRDITTRVKDSAACILQDRRWRALAEDVGDRAREREGNTLGTTPVTT